MTVINYETGEMLDANAAAARAERICDHLDSTAEKLELAMTEMRAAIRDRDDIALDYRSPGDYLSERFGGRLARLGVDLRREVVKELTEAGLSTRAIAPVVGVSNKTVHSDLHSGVTSGNTSSPSRPTEDVEPTLADSDDVEPDVQPEGGAFAAVPQTPVSDEGEHDAQPPRPLAPVVGIDGKTYPKRQQQPQRRAPLPDSYLRHLHVVRQKTESLTLTRLGRDDRWSTNRETVTGRNASEVLYALREFSTVVTQLDPAVIAANEKARQWWLASLNEITDALHGFGTTLKEMQ